MRFNENVKKIRKNLRISQENIAEQLGVSRQAVAKWESGETFPDIDKLIQLSELFCITKCVLVGQSIHTPEIFHLRNVNFIHHMLGRS